MFVRANGLDMHVQMDGPAAAPPLVLLHSLGTSLHVWDAQARALSSEYRVVRPDLRGHGLTAVTPGPGSMDTMAADVLALMDALEIGQAHVAGLSIGGMIAQTVALLASDRVDTLVLCDTAMVIPPPQGWHDRAALVRAQGMEAVADSVVARWVTPAFRATPAAMGLRMMLLRTATEGYAAAAEALAGADLTSRITGMNKPALVLVGEHDEATPLASAQSLQKALGAQLEVLPGAAHIPTVEVPDLVTDAIRRFLAKGA